MRDIQTFLLRTVFAACVLYVVMPGTAQANLVGVGCTSVAARNCALNPPGHGTVLTPGNTYSVIGSQELDNAYSPARQGHSVSCTVAVLLGTDPDNQYSFSIGTISANMSPNILGPANTSPVQWYKCTFSGSVTMPPVASLPASLQTAIQNGTQIYLIVYPMFSDLTTGEMHMMNVGSYGEHVTINAPATTYALTVNKNPTAGGTVTGTGINCGSDCSESYTGSPSVTLTASAASGYTFTGWSGDCSGGSCSLSMNANKTVTANFTAAAPITCGTAHQQTLSCGDFVNCLGGRTICSSGTYTGYAGTEPSGQPTLALYNGSTWVGWDWTCSGSSRCVSCLPGYTWNGSNCAAACTDTSWSPDPSTVCSGQSFTQTGSPCGTTRSAIGTMSCVPPSTPTVTASRQCSGTTPYVYLTYWGSGATSYNIRYCTGTSCSPSTVIPSADPWGFGAYSHTGVTVGTTYGYQVQAVNAYGASAWSSPAQYVSVTVCPPTAPSLTATAQCSGSDPQVALSYSATGATTYTGQYCNTSSSCTPSLALFTGSASTAYTHTPLTAGTVYRYRVNATNAGGTSAWSTIRSATASSTCAPTLTVTKNPPAGGTVTGTGINCGSDCSESYTGSPSITLTQNPASGYAFTGWSGACSGTGSCVVSMSASKTVTANYATSYTLTVIPAGEASSTGSVSSTPAGITCGTDCSETYTNGTNVTLNATSTDSHVVAAFTGGCTGTGSCTVSMTNAKTVNVTFSCGAGYMWDTPSGTCVVLNYCGSANGGTFRNPPTTNLCVPGATASGVTTSGNSFTWTCTGPKGTTNCSATKGSGGAS